jgi:hypothetical protein
MHRSLTTALIAFPLIAVVSLPASSDLDWTSTAQHDQVNYLCSVFGESSVSRQAGTEPGEPSCQELPR